MPEHPDLQDEQEFLNRAYDGLEFMRGEARQMLQGVLDLGRGGTFQSRTERDIVVRTSLARLEQLDIGDQALYFGRIDRLPEPGDGADRRTRCSGESFHIGRLAVSGPDHEPLVVDWRAPVAEPFYRATGLDPQGLARRRHLAVRGRAVLGLEDEYFVDPEGRAGCRGARRSRRRRSSGRRRGAPAVRRAGPGRARRAPLRARPGADGPDGRHHRHHPARAGRDHPLAAARGPRRPGRPRHREDGGGAAPRRLPPLHPPLPAGAPGRARRGAEPVVPALHRAGPPLARRDRGQPLDGRGPGARGARARRRRRRRWPSSRATCGWSRCWPGPCGPASARSGTTSRSPSAPACCGCAPATTEDIVGMARRRPGTHNARRRFVESQVLRALADEYRARLGRERHRGAGRGADAPRSRRTWRSGCAGCPRSAKRSTGCGPACRPTSSCTTCSAPGRCSPPPARGS